MGTSKVTLDGTTLIDLSGVTVTEDRLVDGASAHDKYGDAITGDGRIYENQILTRTYVGDYENSHITSIGLRAFSNQVGMTGLSALNVEIVKNYVCSGCTNLTTLSLPKATEIGNYAFNSNIKLATVNIPKVETIGDYAFNGCSKLTSIDCPDCTTIGSYSFQNCSELASVNMPSLTAIPESGFNTCRKLKTLNAPNVTSIAHAGLQYCGLAELRSTKLRGISGYGMRGSGSLKTVYIPNATWISEQGLASCGKIASAYWPRVSSIGAYQFNSVNVILPLRKVAYPSLKSIPTDGFHNSYGMLAFDFGTQMTNVGQRGFQNSPHLTALIFRRKDSVPTLVNVNAFDSTPFKSGGAGATIYIPKVLYDHLGDGTALDYQSATNWSTIHARGTITWAQIEGSEYEHYYADGVPCSDIYWTLTNATLSSSIIFVDYEQPYSVTVTPDIGCEISTVVVKMGGVDITQTSYNSSTGSISIQSVTDYVRIEVVATVIQEEND